MHPLESDLHKGPGSEGNTIGTGLSNPPELLGSSELIEVGKTEMGKDVGRGGTWTSYEKSKLEIRQGAEWEGGRGLHHYLSSLKSQGDRSLCSSLMQALSGSRGKGQELQASGRMSADDVGQMDGTQVLQEASSLETTIWGNLNIRYFHA